MHYFITLRKLFLTILLFLFYSQLQAQKTQKFYDYSWNECPPNVARFYSLITKTDSGYCRKDYYFRERRLMMLGNYKDAALETPTGKFYYLYPDGTPKTIGMYIDGKKEGVWMNFHRNNTLKDSAIFHNNNRVGLCLAWYPNGRLSDSTYINEDGTGYSVSWFDNGFLSSRGKYISDKHEDGVWEYYHYNGKMSSLETYQNYKLIHFKYFDEEGVEMNDTVNHDTWGPRFSDNELDWIKLNTSTVNYIGLLVRS